MIWQRFQQSQDYICCNVCQSANLYRIRPVLQLVRMLHSFNYLARWRFLSYYRTSDHLLPMNTSYCSPSLPVSQALLIIVSTRILTRRCFSEEVYEIMASNLAGSTTWFAWMLWFLENESKTSRDSYRKFK